MNEYFTRLALRYKSYGVVQLTLYLAQFSLHEMEKISLNSGLYFKILLDHFTEHLRYN